MNNIKLNQIIQLIKRSPDIGDGWRNVSRAVMPLIKDFPDQSLIEIEFADDGTGMVRLTEKGNMIAPYLEPTP